MKYSFKNAEFVLRKVKDYLNQDIAFKQQLTHFERSRKNSSLIYDDVNFGKMKN